MGIYSFRNKETGEEVEMQFSIAEKEEFQKKNPHMEQLITKVNIVDPMGIGIMKPPSDFMKGVVGRMQKAIPGNTIGRYSRFKVPKEI